MNTAGGPALQAVTAGGIFKGPREFDVSGGVEWRAPLVINCKYLQSRYSLNIEPNFLINEVRESKTLQNVSQ